MFIVLLWYKYKYICYYCVFWWWWWWAFLWLGSSWILPNQHGTGDIDLSWHQPCQAHSCAWDIWDASHLSPWVSKGNRQTRQACPRSPGVLQKSDSQVLSFLHGAQADQSLLATCAPVRLGWGGTALWAVEDFEWFWSKMVDNRHASAKCRHSQAAKENHVQWGSAGPKPRVDAMKPC